MDKLLPRLLSQGAQGKRMALLDNIKALRFSWAELEGLITCSEISGRMLYVGEGTRPNLLNWTLTLNNASLSKDMAQRTIIVRLARPPRDPRWWDDTVAMIEAQRWQIIGDIIAVLKSAPATPLTKYTRWAAWEAAVLAHVAAPADCQKVIAERQEAVDDDAAEATIVRDYFYDELQRRGHDPDTDVIWIPSNVAATLLNQALNENRPTNKAANYLRTLGIEELQKSDRGGFGRGWVWRGRKAPQNSRTVQINKN
jgi:hypothetical protein